MHLKACLTFLTFTLSIASLFAQSSDYKHQLDLIDSLKVFIAKDLKLDIPEDFYTKWTDSKDSMYLYVYAADAKHIAHGDTTHRSSWYYTNEDTAKAKVAQLKAKGYHTMLYRTAGTSAAELNRKLLSYPDVALAFIIIHEAVHNHIRNNEKYKGYPYVYEESLCDAVAILGMQILVRQGRLLDAKAVEKHTRSLERCYAILNKAHDKLDDTEHDALILQATNRRMMRYTRNANQFLKDRMRYEVNNAYLLRTRDYSLHYFELKKQLHHLSVTDVVKQVMKAHGPKN